MSTITVRPYVRHLHYPFLSTWWAARGDKCLPADVLPPTGAVAYDGDQPVAMCSIWLTNAKAAYLAFPITAPSLQPFLAWRAASAVVEEAIAIAKRSGVSMIWASAENRGVDRIFRRAGLTLTTPLNSYFLLLDPAVSHDILVGEDFIEETCHAD